MTKFNRATVITLKDLYALGDKPTSEDYYNFLDAIQDGIQEHLHAHGGGQGSGTGNATAIEYFHAVLDVNLYNIHAWKRLLTTRPDLTSYIPQLAWEGI